MRRLLIAEMVGATPGELRFGQSEHGKPSLDGVGADIFFNASHSVDCGVVVAGDQALGVDVERIDRDIDHADFARRCFTEQEAREIVERSGDELARVFFNCWTGKEAYIKGLGVGLSKGLRSFEVRCAPDTEPGLVWDREYPNHPSRWEFVRFCDGQHIVTVAIHGDIESEKPRVCSLSGESLLAGTAVSSAEQSSWREC